MRQSLSPSRMVLPGSRPGLYKSPAGNCSLDRDDKYEIKSGKLLLMHRIGQKTVWLPVYVRVYRNAFEHFAVVSKDQAISANSTYVNLKSSSCCGVVPSGTTPSPIASSSPTKSPSKISLNRDDSSKRFTVVQNNFEGTVISFDCSEDNDDVAEWVEAFSNVTPPASPTQGGMSPTLSPAIPRSPVMPTLTELDEEE